MIDKVLQEDLDNIADSSLPFEELYNTTVMVTGATGLVGMQTVKALLNMNRRHNAGIRVIALVRNADKAAHSYEGFECDELSIVSQDITESIDIKDKVDYIVHTASPTASKFFVEHPVETIKTAIDGTDNILNFAAKVQARGVVYLSSMEAFGITDPSLEYVK